MDFLKDRVITKTDWIIIGISLFLLIVISLGYFVVAGVLDKGLEEMNQQITEAQERLADTRIVAAKKDGLESELVLVKEEIASFEGRLPTEKEVPKLLNQLQRIAGASGVKYRSITAESIAEHDLFVRIPFNVKVEGSFVEIGDFLRRLEFGDRFIKVEKVNIGAEEEGRSEATLAISTYMFVNKTVLSQNEGTPS
jgi:type IV pilus assembly protein PilO